jgi:hypothetical protein
MRVLSASTPLVVTRVEALDAFNNGDDLLVHERRLAADTVPTQQDLHHDRGVHTVPQQMPGQRGDRVVTCTLADALPDEPTPMRDRMPEPPRLLDRLSQHPVPVKNSIRPTVTEFGRRCDTPAARVGAALIPHDREP